MKKFTFIGAGSLDFTKDLVRDILTFEAFRDAELMLMDIDPKRLEYAVKGVQKIVDAGKYPAVVKGTQGRKEALKDADGVLITILQGGVEVWRHDIEIPKKYNVDICVGDTRGPSGIFRFLRTAPVLLDIIRDCEEVCPNAVVLNYTNPMAMLVSYLQSMSDMNITGLCHSVQGTARILPRSGDVAGDDFLCESGDACQFLPQSGILPRSHCRHLFYYSVFQMALPGARVGRFSELVRKKFDLYLLPPCD